MVKIKKPLGSNYNRFKHKPRNIHPRAFEKAYWPYLPLLLVVVLGVAITAQFSGLNQLNLPGHSRVLGYSVDMSNQSLLQATNNQRINDNLADLQLNAQLQKAAQTKVNDMVKRNYWSHQTPDGKSPWTFVAAQDYQYQKLGENLAAGFSDATSVIKAWLASASHRQILLDPNYSNVGFGFANSPSYTSAGGGPMTVVVAYFGQPVSATPVPVNSSSPSATTNSPIADYSSLGSTTTKAQLALAHSTIAPLASSLAIVTITAGILVILGRHIVSLRRAWRKGEKFVIRHPGLDIFLIAVVLVAFILSQTAGFVK